MKRLFVLLLICLLPMQVFAGVVTYYKAQAQSLPGMTTELAGQADAQHGSPSDAASCDNENFSQHAGLGDEPVLHMGLMFVADSTRLAPALRSDAAIQPPFLPPAARPPRV